MLKQRFAYVISKIQANTGLLYTAHTVPVTLLQDEDGQEKKNEIQRKDLRLLDCHRRPVFIAHQVPWRRQRRSDEIPTRVPSNRG